MAWNISERFPSWGETGEFPAAGFFYEGGDQVNEKHMDALWNGINGLEEDVQAALNDIDSDGDGEVDAADIARALDSSEVGDGLNGGNGTALSVDVSDFAGSGLQDDGSENLRLTNDTVTVAGNAVALGGSTGVALGDLSNVTASGEGSGNGFDADTVDGQHANDIGKSTNDIQRESLIHSEGFAPGFGG